MEASFCQIHYQPWKGGDARKVGKCGQTMDRKSSLDSFFHRVLPVAESGTSERRFPVAVVVVVFVSVIAPDERCERWPETCSLTR